MAGRFYPASVASLGAMIDEDAQISTWCDRCGEWKRFTRDELIALAEIKGRGFSLINRRTRCRLTPGCDGWNQFRYLRGVMRHLCDSEVMERWVIDGMKERSTKPRGT